MLTTARGKEEGKAGTMREHRVYEPPEMSAARKSEQGIKRKEDIYDIYTLMKRNERIENTDARVDPAYLRSRAINDSRGRARGCPASLQSIYLVSARAHARPSANSPLIHFARSSRT